MIRKTTKIINDTGLHARPASIFITEAVKFKSNIEIIRGEKAFNAKSIILLLSAGLSCGTEIEICADGEDEEQAVNTLIKLIESGIGE
ncbi:HPr family phosphocarrier protein [Clostridium sp. DL1XJH146]